MAELLNFNSLGGNLNDTFKGRKIIRVVSDGEYIYAEQDAVTIDVIDDDTFATALSTNVSSAESSKSYSDRRDAFLSALQWRSQDSGNLTLTTERQVKYSGGTFSKWINSNSQTNVVSAQDPVLFQKIDGQGNLIGAPSADIDNLQYDPDNLGVLANASDFDVADGNDVTAQQVFLDPVTEKFYIQYGSKVYSSKTLGLSSWEATEKRHASMSFNARLFTLVLDENTNVFTGSNTTIVNTFNKTENITPSLLDLWASDVDLNYDTYGSTSMRQIISLIKKSRDWYDSTTATLDFNNIQNLSSSVHGFDASATLSSAPPGGTVGGLTGFTVFSGDSTNGSIFAFIGAGQQISTGMWYREISNNTWENWHRFDTDLWADTAATYQASSGARIRIGDGHNIALTNLGMGNGAAIRAVPKTGWGNVPLITATDPTWTISGQPTSGTQEALFIPDVTTKVFESKLVDTTTVAPPIRGTDFQHTARDLSVQLAGYLPTESMAFHNSSGDKGVSVPTGTNLIVIVDDKPMSIVSDGSVFTIPKGSQGYFVFDGTDYIVVYQSAPVLETNLSQKVVTVDSSVETMTDQTTSLIVNTVWADIKEIRFEVNDIESENWTEHVYTEAEIAAATFNGFYQAETASKTVGGTHSKVFKRSDTTAQLVGLDTAPNAGVFTTIRNVFINGQAIHTIEKFPDKLFSNSTDSAASQPIHSFAMSGGNNSHHTTVLTTYSTGYSIISFSDARILNFHDPFSLADVANNRLTIKNAGTYFISFSARVTNKDITIRLNGAIRAGSDSSTGVDNLTTSLVKDLDVGDVIEFGDGNNVASAGAVQSPNVSIIQISTSAVIDTNSIEVDTQGMVADDTFKYDGTKLVKNDTGSSVPINDQSTSRYQDIGNTRYQYGTFNSASTPTTIPYPAPFAPGFISVVHSVSHNAANYGIFTSGTSPGTTGFTCAAVNRVDGSIVASRQVSWQAVGTKP